MIKSLTAMPYAQAHVTIYDNGNFAVILTSYATAVAYIDREGFLTITGLYSATTRRHLSAFVKEYCGMSYAQAKEVYTRNIAYNIYTGEIKEN